MECGIVGLPLAGKTCLFAALTGGGAGPPDPGRPHVGVAEIPDPRLDRLAGRVQTRKVTPAAITFVDLPGLDPDRGAAHSASVLAHVRQVDALCEVVRCFGGATGPPDPAADIRRLEDELILADLAVAEPALEKAKRPAQAGDADARARLAVLERLMGELGEGRPARGVSDWSDADRVILRSFGFASAKPVLYVANVDEDDPAGEGPAAQAVREHAAASGGEAVAVCAKLEAELAELDPDDRREMLEGLSLREPAIGPLARAACRLLGLAIFYTTSEKETRAWTVAADATAQQAAGVVHSDMERGFIRAECYGVDDLAEHGSEKALRAAGRLRTEGKHSRIRDGDVMKVLFNV